MRFSVDWIDDAINAAAEEAATVADFQLWTGEQNITLHLRDGAVHDHVTIALYALAEGLAHDWWQIVGRRDWDSAEDSGFSLRRYRSGFVLPDLRFRCDGAAFDFWSAQMTLPQLRFWQGPSELLTRAAAEDFLSTMVEAVLARLDDRGVRDSGAARRWDRVQQSRIGPEAAFCEACGALGLDPYRIDDSAAATIEEAEARFEGEALTELLAGTRTARAAARNSDAARLLEWVDYAEHRTPFKARMGDIDAAAAQVAAAVPVADARRPWALGYRRARAARQALALDAVARFRSFRQLATAFGASPGFEPARKVDGIRALRSEGPNGTRIHLRNHGDTAQASAQHLFTLARAVGDVFCYPETRRAAVNDLHHASRQAAGRAFAAEFLAPVDEVGAMLDDGHDLVSIADEFGVAPAVIERQIENADRIGECCAIV